MKKFEIFKRGLIAENPVFVLLLGLCSTLAITTTLTNAIGMGMAVMAVLLMSNVIISLLRKIIPDEIRIPVFIVIIATLVKCVQMIMNAFTPALYESLGVFIPLIVVNCIILGRAESFASKNGVVDSIFDALGMGVGYMIAVLVMSGIRQLIGSGGLSLVNPFDATQVIFDIKLFADYAVSLFTQPAGAFITLGCILAFMQMLNVRKEKKAKEEALKAKEAAKKGAK